VSLTASENLRVAITRGNAVLVQLTGTGWSGTVDFKSSIDGATWTNAPYEQVHVASPTKSVAQITSVSTAVLYFIRPPVVQVRIDVVVSGGTLDVVYREINVEN
jgi:hypothetical protein